MRFSIEPRDRTYVKGCRFLYFAKNMGKRLNSKYGKNFLIVLKNLLQMLWKQLQKENSKNRRSNWRLNQ